MECCKSYIMGMILAAGRGVRMGNLTANQPKPLLKVRGKPLIEYSIRLLLNWGIRDIVVNLHYRKEDLLNYFAKLQLPVRIIPSIEEELLGTGGGVKKAERFLFPHPFFLLNSDIITDFPLKKLLIDPLPVATMVLVPYRDGYTPVWVKDEEVTGFGETGNGEKFTFAGIHLLRSEIFKYLPEGKSSIIDSLYKKLLKNGQKIRAVIWDGLWLDLGTEEKYHSIKSAIESGDITLPDFYSGGIIS